MNKLPLLFNYSADKPIFRFDNEIISHKKFLHDVFLLANNLKDQEYVINLCEDRYFFALGFAAAMLRQQVSLLPASKVSKDIEALVQDYPDCYVLDNNLVKLSLENKTTIRQTDVPLINAEQAVTIVFTSGSSGTPKANPKTWAMLVDSAQRVAEQLNFNQPSQHSLVATVPPQHMYGFETSIVFPLVNGVCVSNTKPFFPEDIRQQLEKENKPVILVTTPVHLRACTQVNIQWPAIDFVLSATAPLSKELALTSEKLLNTTIKEIYGCSETGVIATRSTTKDSAWKLLPGYVFSEKFTGTCLTTPVARDEILLPDEIEILDQQHFNLLGRQSDIVKIAGKRGSLNDLKIKLCAHKGIKDAVFFMPHEHPDEKARLAAFVVAPGYSIKEIQSFLSNQIDAAFMPRPLIKVEQLPYNDTGKLPVKNLLVLLNQYRDHLKDSA